MVWESCSVAIVACDDFGVSITELVTWSDDACVLYYSSGELDRVSALPNLQVSGDPGAGALSPAEMATWANRTRGEFPNLELCVLLVSSRSASKAMQIFKLDKLLSTLRVEVAVVFADLGEDPVDATLLQAISDGSRTVLAIGNAPKRLRGRAASAYRTRAAGALVAFVQEYLNVVAGAAPSRVLKMLTDDRVERRFVTWSHAIVTLAQQRASATSIAEALHEDIMINDRLRHGQASLLLRGTPDIAMGLGTEIQKALAVRIGDLPRIAVDADPALSATLEINLVIRGSAYAMLSARPAKGFRDRGMSRLISRGLRWFLGPNEASSRDRAFHIGRGLATLMILVALVLAVVDGRNGYAKAREYRLRPSENTVDEQFANWTPGSVLFRMLVLRPGRATDYDELLDERILEGRATGVALTINSMLWRARYLKHDPEYILRSATRAEGVIGDLTTPVLLALARVDVVGITRSVSATTTDADTSLAGAKELDVVKEVTVAISAQSPDNADMGEEPSDTSTATYTSDPADQQNSLENYSESDDESARPMEASTSALDMNDLIADTSIVARSAEGRAWLAKTLNALVRSGASDQSLHEAAKLLAAAPAITLDVLRLNPSAIAILVSKLDSALMLPGTPLAESVTSAISQSSQLTTTVAKDNAALFSLLVLPSAGHVSRPLQIAFERLAAGSSLDDAEPVLKSLQGALDQRGSSSDASEIAVDDTKASAPTVDRGALAGWLRSIVLNHAARPLAADIRTSAFEQLAQIDAAAAQLIFAKPGPSAMGLDRRNLIAALVNADPKTVTPTSIDFAFAGPTIPQIRVKGELTESMSPLVSTFRDYVKLAGHTYYGIPKMLPPMQPADSQNRTDAQWIALARERPWFPGSDDALYRALYLRYVSHDDAGVVALYQTLPANELGDSDALPLIHIMVRNAASRAYLAKASAKPDLLALGNALGRIYRALGIGDDHLAACDDPSPLLESIEPDGGSNVCKAALLLAKRVRSGAISEEQVSSAFEVMDHYGLSDFLNPMRTIGHSKKVEAARVAEVADPWCVAATAKIRAQAASLKTLAGRAFVNAIEERLGTCRPIPTEWEPSEQGGSQ